MSVDRRENAIVRVGQAPVKMGRDPMTDLSAQGSMMSEASNEVGCCVLLDYLFRPCAFDICQYGPNFSRIQLVFIGRHVAVHAGGRKDPPSFANKIK